MYKTLTCLAVEHDWRLVVLALGVCFLASLTAVSVFHHARSVGGRGGIAWLAGAAVATGCGIWATHFIAMLAYDPAIPVSYSADFTVLSLAIAIAVAGAGMTLALVGQTIASGMVGGAVVGAGVALMHYTGMWALEVPGRVAWDPSLVVSSIVFGVVFGAAALALAHRRNGARYTLLAALLLTVAIVTLHFTAMGAIEIVPDPTRVIDTFSLSPGLLALAIANAGIAILGLSLAAAFADRRLRRKDRETATALNNMAQGLVMFDGDARLVLWNERYIEMYGLSPEVVKTGCRYLDLVGHRKETGTFSEDPETYCRRTVRRIAAGETWSLVAELPDGRSIQVVQRPVANGGWVATHEDISERQEAQRRIEYLAHHDPLTGLPNRAAFNRYLSGALETAAQRGGALAVLCIDLDRFKEINDVFGHAAGDGLLIEVAKRLANIADGSFTARLGGDEFSIVVTENQHPTAAAEELAERLQAAMATEIEIDGQLVLTNLSIGVAVYPSDGTDVATLLANGDAALYRAKYQGRNRICFFDAGMDQQIRERRMLQHELRLAVETDQLKLFYQPQARTDGEIIGFEALVRWQHPKRGFVSPSVFVPLAEESGFIIQLGARILRQACSEAASWRRPLQVAVNLSPVQFKHGDLPALVHAILLETGLAPQRLELEITEGVLIEDFHRAISILRRLKALGVKIAMDDFGTGYSSLSYLQSFPFDKIKIDQSFVARLHENPHSPAIIRAVIGLARGLSLPVSAEGVETSEQLAFLEKEKCDEIQGFFIGKPQDIDDYAEIVGKTSRGQKALRTA